MTTVKTPQLPAAEEFTDAAAAVARLEQLYSEATQFLCTEFSSVIADGAAVPHRIRAYYPEIRFTTSSFAQVKARLIDRKVAHIYCFGHCGWHERWF